MLSLGIAAIVGMLVTLLGTPVAVKQFRRRGWGQLIREEGPKAHYEKRGTPTMGGLVILAGCILGYLAGHIGSGGFNPFRDSGLLALVFDQRVRAPRVRRRLHQDPKGTLSRTAGAAQSLPASLLSRLSSHTARWSS